MLFATLGVTAHDEATIAQYCGTTLAGCTVTDLITGAQSFAFRAAKIAVRDRISAVAALSSETPFVAMMDMGCLTIHGPPLQWHFVVPLTLAQDVVTYHDPAEGPDRSAPLDDFLGAWLTAGYQGVRVWIP
jgi:hypothetical protein